MPENEATLSELIGSILRGSIGTVRSNKVAAAFAAVALAGTTLIAFNSQYDERPRYSQAALPEINELFRIFIADCGTKSL